MKQYKELSGLRTEQEKMLNAQKVQKMRNQNVSQKVQDDIENQQRDFDEMVERLQIVQELQQI